MKSRKSQKRRTEKAAKVSTPMNQSLLIDIRDLILSARKKVAQTANATLTLLHWQIGNRIRREILKEKRAAYGAEILQTLSAKLTMEFSRGFSQRNLASMVRFADVFPDLMIVQSLITQLGWTHFKPLIPIDDPLRWESDAKMSNRALVLEAHHTTHIEGTQVVLEQAVSS